ncbi:hypothetical protein [Undibacterium sp. Ji22W]|uniref:hypothetical protein n=1 Tax=Undibacterium sp. Ji22W TaxID=3413038 RepID=UPI003BF1818B
MTVDIDRHIIKCGDEKKYIIATVLEGIRLLLLFMTRVIYQNELYLTSYKTKLGKECKKVSSLGSDAKSLHKFASCFSTDYRFSPLIEFFFDEYCKHAIKNFPSSNIGRDIASIELFNDFVTTMRRNAAATKLKKRVNDWVSKTKKNEKHLQQFEAELFGRNSSLMVVRLDFHYHAAVFKREEIHQIMVREHMQEISDQFFLIEGNPLTDRKPNQGRISLDEVQKDRVRLFTNMKGKPSLFEHSVGYIWHIESAKSAGYRLHVMYFFDGSQVKDCQYIGQEIGDYWVETITNGRGYFECCNDENSHVGEEWVIGEVNRFDNQKRKRLLLSMQFFCKANLIVQDVPYVGCHLFGSGFFRLSNNSRRVFARPKTEFSSNDQGGFGT